MWQHRVLRRGDPKFCPKYILKQDTHTGNHPLSGSCHKVHMCRELECHNCNSRPIPRCLPRASKVGRHIPQLRNLVGIIKNLLLFQTRARKILKHQVGLEKLELFCNAPFRPFLSIKKELGIFINFIPLPQFANGIFQKVPPFRINGSHYMELNSILNVLSVR